MNYPGSHTLFPAEDGWQHRIGGDAIATYDSPEERCLTLLMETIGTELATEALFVGWFPTMGEDLVLHMNDQCRINAGARVLLDEFATKLANAAEGRDQPFVQETQTTRGRLTALAFPSAEGVIVVTSLVCRAQASAAARSKLAGYIPILRPFFDLWMANRMQSAQIAGLKCAVENCDTPTLLVDRHCKVVFANRAAEKLAARKDGITIGRGRLAASELTDTMRLQAAVEHICGEARDTAAMLPIVALRRVCGRHLMVTAVAVPASQTSTAGNYAILYAFDPDEDLSRLIEPACKFYRLSAGETRLACRLANGASLTQAAKALGLREQTARSYLKQIFLKTQTNRQAELVWLMLKSAVRVTNTARMCIL